VNFKYGDDVMWQLLDKIKKAGDVPEDYIVKLFGGANVLFKDNGNSSLNVAHKNIETAIARIKNSGFLIHAHHVGGNKPCKIFFELWSGDVWLKEL